MSKARGGSVASTSEQPARLSARIPDANAHATRRNTRNDTHVTDTASPARKDAGASYHGGCRPAVVAVQREQPKGSIAPLTDQRRLWLLPHGADQLPSISSRRISSSSHRCSAADSSA